jgi:putative FmdB family regulatory protein
LPTYEYACRSCEAHLEVVQRFTDDPLTECPECGGSLRKVFSPVGIAFKGSGFYKTDSRSGSGGRSSGSSGSSSTSSEGSGGSGADGGGSSGGGTDTKATSTAATSTTSSD